jgi:hypothetical protein
MRTIRSTLLVGVALFYAIGVADAQSKTIEGDTVSVTVTIEAIEAGTRTLTVKDAEGFYETIQVPPEIKRFSELKVGDKITTRYYDNVVVRLKKPGEPAVDVDSEAVTRGKGARPAGTASSQRTITVTVTAIDPKTASISVSGPNGWKYSQRVDDKKALAQLKVGDRLDLTWTEAVMLSVESAK